MIRAVLKHAARASLLGAASAFIGSICITVYYHRVLTHYALILKGWAHFPFRVISWITTLMKRKEWADTHRKHHIFSDQPEDPHSPVQRGTWYVFWNNHKLFTKGKAAPDILAGLYDHPADPPYDWWDRHVFRRADVAVGILGAIYFFVTRRGGRNFIAAWLLGRGQKNPVYALALASLAVVVHVRVFITGGAAVNAFSHSVAGMINGGRSMLQSRFGDNSQNRPLIGALTLGEGMHADHHDYPTSWGIGPLIRDIGGWVCRLLIALRVARPRTPADPNPLLYIARRLGKEELAAKFEEAELEDAKAA